MQSRKILLAITSLLLYFTTTRGAPIPPTPTSDGQTRQLDSELPPSLLAYDCSALDVQRTISADQVGPCHDPKDWPSRQRYGTILQAKTTSPLTLFACQVRSINSIAYCGMHSLSSLTTNAVTMEVETLGREACIMAVSYTHLTLPTNREV